MTDAPAHNYVFLSGEAQPLKDLERRYWVVPTTATIGPETDDQNTGDFSDGCGEPVGNDDEQDQDE